MKPCMRCKIIKPFSDFPKRRKSRDGLHTHCRDCVNKDQRRGYISRARGEARLSVEKNVNRSNPCGCNNYRECMTCRNYEKRDAWKHGRVPVFRLAMIAELRG